MKAETLINALEAIAIHDYIGVPDSTLKSFCDYLYLHKSPAQHHVPVNEGAALAMAAGIYLASGQISCVYMQNSGLGNAVNPITSLLHEKVYAIPMLFIIGYRGQPGYADEPQHKFQGAITLPMLELLEIPYAVLKKDDDASSLSQILKKAQECFQAKKQFAIVVEKGALESEETLHFQNGFHIRREEAIQHVISLLQPEDVIISTTGKISREVYEQSNAILGHHKQAFLTVGSMGHASMIAQGIALKCPHKRVFCFDGDGAALMHMGSMNYIAQQPCENLIHIVFNNLAHESVGGMPTQCAKTPLHEIAKAMGYKHVLYITDLQELDSTLQRNYQGPVFIEIGVAVGSRADLGRPKETAVENKEQFMSALKGEY